MRMIQELTTLGSGQSYWKAKLSTGKVLCELDTVTDIRSASTRKVEWLEDLIGSGDLDKVREVMLCTPQGDAHIATERECAFFQLKQGIASLFDGERTRTAQIVGCLNDDDGGCVCAIWDALEQRLYTDFSTNVLRFDKWRDGIIPPGRLAIEALGLVL